MTSDRPATPGTDVQLGRLRPELNALLDAIPDYRPGDVDAIRTVMAAAFGSPLPEPDEVMSARACDGREIEVRIHRPQGNGRGTIMHIHGGGFVMGSAELYDGVCRELADATGFVVASVDYRLAPEHPYPAALDDCTATWEWLTTTGAVVGVDGARVGLYGESAGAALALGVAHRVRASDAPDAAVLVLQEPVTDDRLSTASSQEFTATPIWNRALAEWSWQSYLGPHHGEPPEEAAPARLASYGGFPPTFISTRDLDPLRDEGLMLAQRMIGDGVDVELRHYAGTVHGTLGLEGTRVRERILRDTVEYLVERFEAP